jgi:tetratricopeptide (TPR) repeat protein
MHAALRLRPHDGALLAKLSSLLEATADWSRAVDVAVLAAEQIQDPRARAMAFVEAADRAVARARNVGRAVALYEAAISDDPEVPGAFEAIEKVLLDAGDFAGAEQAYRRQLERLAGRGAAEATLLDKLARVREEHLGDRTGAIQALDLLVALRPDDVDALGRLARLLEDNGEDELALKILEVSAQHAPGRVETFRALFRIHARRGDADGAYCAAGVLIQLGEAEASEQAAYQQFAPAVGVRPTQAFDDAGWRSLFPPELEQGALALFAAVAPAAVDARLEQLRAKKALPSLDPNDRHDPERTTVSAVRTAAWISRLLGMPVPGLYVSSRDLPGGLAVAPTRELSLVLGPSILSGRSVSELAFVFARELSYLRLTARLLVFYPDIADLRRLVTAAISIAIGHTGPVPADVEPFRRDLGKRLDPAHLDALSQAVRAASERGGQVDLLVWLRAVERAACRIGLAACGDLPMAARALSVDGRVVSGLSAAERLRDLVPFSVSAPYGELRMRLGIRAA